MTPARPRRRLAPAVQHRRARRLPARRPPVRRLPAVASTVSASTVSASDGDAAADSPAAGGDGDAAPATQRRTRRPRRAATRAAGPPPDNIDVPPPAGAAPAAAGAAAGGAAAGGRRLRLAAHRAGRPLRSHRASRRFPPCRPASLPRQRPQGLLVGCRRPRSSRRRLSSSRRRPASPLTVAGRGTRRTAPMTARTRRAGTAPRGHPGGAAAAVAAPGTTTPTAR